MQLDTVVSSWGGKSPELIACGILSLGQANRDQLESASIRFVGERSGHGGEGSGRFVFHCRLLQPGVLPWTGSRYHGACVVRFLGVT